MYSQVVNITPKQAALWLSENTTNRRIDRRIVEQHKRSMTSGQWTLNGETISIAKDGRLLNGQHRLTACQEAGVNFKSLVAFGIDPEAFSTIDTGKPRSAADIMNIHNEQNATTLAAALTALARYEKGIMLSWDKVTNQDIEDTLERHPEMRNAIKASNAMPKYLRSGVIGFLTYMGSLVDAEKTAEFIYKLKTGANLREGDPALTLRNFFLTGRTSAHGGNITVLKSFFCVKALNATLLGRKVHNLRRGPTEEFPSIPGFPYGEKVDPGDAVDFVIPVTEALRSTGRGQLQLQ
jgi:hypothetical protein